MFKISIKNMVQFISFGGAGGCGIGIRLREIGFMAYPFDWMMCAQSFISNYFTKETKKQQMMKKKHLAHSISQNENTKSVTIIWTKVRHNYNITSLSEVWPMLLLLLVESG